METWYCASAWGGLIDSVKVERSTNRMVVLEDGARVYKHTPALCYFPTWEEARDYLLHRVRHEVCGARQNLADAEKRLREIQALKPKKRRQR